MLRAGGGAASQEGVVLVEKMSACLLGQFLERPSVATSSKKPLKEPI